MDRRELRVRVGDVQQARVAETRDVIEAVVAALESGTPGERQPRGARGGQRVQELAAAQR